MYYLKNYIKKKKLYQKIVSYLKMKVLQDDRKIKINKDLLILKEFDLINKIFKECQTREITKYLIFHSISKGLLIKLIQSLKILIF